jgi:hypothetical protein
LYIGGVTSPHLEKAELTILKGGISFARDNGNGDLHKNGCLSCVDIVYDIEFEFLSNFT